MWPDSHPIDKPAFADGLNRNTAEIFLRRTRQKSHGDDISLTPTRD